MNAVREETSARTDSCLLYRNGDRQLHTGRKKQRMKDNEKEKEKGMIKLNFAGIRSREEMYRYLQGKLNLPESRGENLDNI